MNQIVVMAKGPVSWLVYKDLLVNFIRVLSDYKKYTRIILILDKIY